MYLLSTDAGLSVGECADKSEEEEFMLAVERVLFCGRYSGVCDE